MRNVLELAHARHRIADASGLEKGDRQRHETADQPGAEFDVDTVGRVGKEVDAQDTKDRLEHRDGDQAYDQNVERAQVGRYTQISDHADRDRIPSPSPDPRPV